MGSYEKKENTNLIENHKEDEVTSHFTYDDLFHKHIKLNKETSKLKYIVCTFKTTIYFIKIESKNLLEDVECLKEIHKVCYFKVISLLMKFLLDLSSVNNLIF